MINIVRENFFQQKKLRILDIACGNGRFYKFLTRHLTDFHIVYLGIDSNPKVIKYALHENPGIKIANEDILEDGFSLKENYDVVVIFGFMHHLPGKIYRLRWLSKICQKLNKNGLLIVSLWNFSVQKARQELPLYKIYTNDLEKGDLFLGWKDRKIYRYCHYFDENDIVYMIKKLKIYGFDILTKYRCKDDLNTYLVFKKRRLI
jgi:SAM-dependent methyltransferase